MPTWVYHMINEGIVKGWIVFPGKAKMRAEAQFTRSIMSIRAHFQRSQGAQDDFLRHPLRT